MTARPAPLAELSADERRKEQHAWYFYDWANSAYVTTVGTVLFSPYLTSVAERAACGRVGTDENPCDTNLHVLGLAISPGSMVFYVVTISTIFSALILPIVGAAADRTGRYKSILAGFAWSGSALAAAMFFVTGTNWQLGALLLVGANLCLGSSLVVYNAILVQIATPDERDRVSTRGWSLGYLGGGVLLALNLVLVLGHSAFGLDKAMAVRVCLFSAAVWWAGFTIIPFRGLRNLPPADVSPGTGGLARSSFSQLWRTLREMVGFPVLMLFLVASLFINDGVQTVTVASSTYGEKQLGFDTSVLIATILMVQFVAFGGALLFGAAAKVFGAKAGIIVALALWIVIVVIAFFLPSDNITLFLLTAVLIGIVLGGTQALSRSLFSQFIPRGREAEYFSLYQAAERGTSWLGTLLFGLVHQWADSYRPAIVALMVFFVIGIVLLSRVDVRRGIADAGNRAPAVV